jgi:hypothetical protein
MEIGQGGYKMDLDKEYLRYLLEQRIKTLSGTKSLILNNEIEIQETVTDIDSQIQALTNMIEML